MTTFSHSAMGMFRRAGVALGLLMLVSPTTALANDGVFYTSGNQLIPWHQHTVKVQKEVLTIRLLNHQEAEVDVYYEFYNPGDAIEQTVGFEAIPPQMVDQEGSLPESTEHPYMSRFTVEMNGEKVTHQSAVVVNDSSVVTGDGLKVLDVKRYETGEGGFGGNLMLKGSDFHVNATYVYFFKARFTPGVNRVHHTYTYRMSESQISRYGLEYKLTPAMRWANRQIDDFTLRLEVKDKGMHFCLLKEAFGDAEIRIAENTEGGKGKYRSLEVNPFGGKNVSAWEFSLRQATAELHVKNFRPQAELYLMASDFQKNGETTAPDLCLPIFVEHEDGKPLTELEKQAKAHWEEAEDGATFKNAKLQRFFNSRWWYMPKK